MFKVNILPHIVLHFFKLPVLLCESNMCINVNLKHAAYIFLASVVFNALNSAALK